MVSLARLPKKKSFPAVSAFPNDQSISLTAEVALTESNHWLSVRLPSNPTASSVGDAYLAKSAKS